MSVFSDNGKSPATYKSRFTYRVYPHLRFLCEAVGLNTEVRKILKGRNWTWDNINKNTIWTEYHFTLQVAIVSLLDLLHCASYCLTCICFTGIAIWWWPLWAHLEVKPQCIVQNYMYLELVNIHKIITLTCFSILYWFPLCNDMPWSRLISIAKTCWSNDFMYVN